jgi:hypothetical protein
MVLKPTSFISSKPETSESQDAGFVTSSKPETIQPRCAGNRIEQAQHDLEPVPGATDRIEQAQNDPQHCSTRCLATLPTESSTLKTISNGVSHALSLAALPTESSKLETIRHAASRRCRLPRASPRPTATSHPKCLGQARSKEHVANPKAGIRRLDCSPPCGPAKQASLNHAAETFRFSIS